MPACQFLRSLPARLLALITLTLLIAPAATARWIDLGSDEPVTVEVLQSSGSRTVYTITIGGFEAEPVTIGGATWYEINLPGESRSYETGLPELPDVRRAVSIADDRAVVVRVMDSEFVDLPDLPVVPSKGSLSRSVDPATVPYTFDAFYQSDGAWPEDVLVGEDPHIIRDLRGLVVDANVFQFFPGTDVLRVYKRLTIEVIESGPGKTNVLDRRDPFVTVDPQFANLYDSHFLNGDASRYDPVPEAGGLLIICYDAFAGAMQPLVEWKRQKGLDTRLVTLAETGSSFAQIKAYLAGALADWAPAYVLLVGDIGQIPIGADSDPEYSTLLGSDAYPELFVGRFSAENADQVATQVLRTITYERDQQAGADWAQYGMGIASDQGPGDDGEYDNEHEDVIRQKLRGYGYLGVDQIYDPTGTATMVTAGLNAGRGIINYTGHGSQTSWGTTGFSNTNVDALVNQDLLPFISSVACNNGTFTGTCFAEAWLRATDGGVPTGAVATYMSYISQDWNPPMCAQDEAVDLLVRDEMRTIGGLWFNGSCLMMDEYGTAGENEFLNWNIFGDPSLAVRTRAAADMLVNHVGTFFIGMNEYVVDTGIAGAVCALYADGVLYGVGTADAGGTAAITVLVAPAGPMTLTLTVTAYNQVTVQEPVSVLPPDGPYLVSESVTVLDTTGDDDGLLDVGETVDLQVELENVGVDSAVGLSATLMTDDPFVSLEVAAAGYPDIPAGDFAVGDQAFTITVLGGAPDGHVAPFTVQITGSGHVWDVAFDLPIQAPALAVVAGLVNDETGGNGSGTADSGEVFSLQLLLTNAGASAAADLAGHLSSADPYVSILGADGTCALVPVGHEGLLGIFEISVDAACPEPSLLVFEVAVTAASGHAQDLQFELAVGGWFDDVESDRGWTIGAVGDDATAGIWLAADPVGSEYNGVTVQMEDDHTAAPGVQCFVTGNALAGQTAGTNDVDGGQTTLLSPVFELANATTATVSYWRWYTNNAGNSPDEDWWDVAVTANGTDWVTLEHTQASAASWQQFSFELSAYVTLTDQVQLRFVASDEGGGSLVEAGVDDFLLDVYYGTVTAIDDGARGLPAVTVLGECYPNPFNPLTRVSFALPSAGEVDLAVYDVSGRRVATLVRGMVAAGRHEVVWRGRDDRGGAVASGVYFSRLVSGGELLTRKMTLLK